MEALALNRKIVGGEMSEKGEPLSKLFIPPIETLINKPQVSRAELEFSQVPFDITSGGTTPVRTVMEAENPFGVHIDIGIHGMISPVQYEINPAQIKGTGTKRPIPTNFPEARSAMGLISNKRSGQKVEFFSLPELRTIAQNLRLPKNGNKDELVNRLISAIKNFYNME